MASPSSANTESPAPAGKADSQRDESLILANADGSFPCLTAPDDAPYTMTQDGKILTVNITSGNMKGEVLHIDLELARRNQLKQQQKLARSQDQRRRRPADEDIPEEGLPPTSYHGPNDELISEEEYERREALERFHEQQGTLHLLYPETFPEDYELHYKPNEDDDDDKDDEDDDDSGD